MKRNYTLDAFKGIAALNIIFIHTVCWSGNEYLSSDIRTLALILDVPFFFFLSGWGGGYSWDETINLQKSCKSVITIYKKYIYFTIFYYTIWSMSNLLLGFYDWNWKGFTKNIVLNLIFTGHSLQYLNVLIGSMWFMPVYVIVMLLIPAILFFCVNRNRSTLDDYMKILLLLSAVALFYIWNHDLFIKVAFHSCFFLIGFMSCHRPALTRRQYILSLIIIGTILLVCRYLFSINILMMQNLKFPPTFTYMIYSLVSVVTALYFKNIQIRERNIFAMIGRNALLFYFSQGISSSIIIPIARRLHFVWYIKLLICFSINLLCCVLIVLILKLYFLMIEKVKVNFVMRGGKTIDP